VTKGLWPMAAEPGPTFRWGALLRASKPKRIELPDGTVKFVEDPQIDKTSNCFAISGTTIWASSLTATRT
jgi:hypothetical protein